MIYNAINKMSNRKALLAVSPDFCDWLDNNELLWFMFEEFASLLEEFLMKNVLVDRAACKNIANNFSYILGKCNEVDWDRPGVVEAYLIYHFLDRYHRFQLIGLSLIKEGLLPVRRLPTDVLDVGTGPAQALYALSDIYYLLKLYGEEKGITRFCSMEISMDYVEKSTMFRLWLHHFTEFINCKASSKKQVPYHHGTFNDIKGLNFQQLKLELQQELIDQLLEENDDLTRHDAQLIIDSEKRGWKDKYRYNLTIFSNFITQIEQVDEWLSELNSTSKALRNSGIIIIVGGRGTPYPDIYNKLNGLFKNAGVYEIPLSKNIMKYYHNDRFGQRIGIFLKKILTKFEMYGLENELDSEIKTEIENRIASKIGESKWEIHAFRKGRWPAPK